MPTQEMVQKHLRFINVKEPALVAYTIDDYANYAVIYFKSNEIEPMKQVKLYKTDDPNLAHAFGQYIANFDIKQLTESKWLVDPEYG